MRGGAISLFGDVVHSGGRKYRPELKPFAFQALVPLLLHLADPCPDVATVSARPQAAQASGPNERLSRAGLQSPNALARTPHPYPRRPARCPSPVPPEPAGNCFFPMEGLPSVPGHPPPPGTQPSGPFSGGLTRRGDPPAGERAWRQVAAESPRGRGSGGGAGGGRETRRRQQCRPPVGGGGVQMGVRRRVSR